MKQIRNSVRVPFHYWMEDENFRTFTEWLTVNRDCIDQVAFFSSYYHPPMPLLTAEKHCAILKKRIAAVRSMGFSCGINILATVGHHPERLDETLQGDYTYATNIDGEVSLGSRCMNDPSYLREYVVPLYRIHCSAHPDFIWIDDDIRAGHIPIGYACFCDRCIGTFNAEYGYSFDRVSLKTAIENPDSVGLRKKWLIFQSRKIAELFRVIRKTVDEENGSIILGFMTGDRFFEGYDVTEWADSLSDGGKHEIMWRPGGGAYTDTSFQEQVGKSCEIGRQIANLPAYVTSIQSEIENCPYQMLKKSPRATVLEAMMHLTVGCTGTAWNFLPNGTIGEPISLISRHIAAIRDRLPFMNMLSGTFGGNCPLGIHNGWHKHSQAAVPQSFVKASGNMFALHTEELFSLGLPEAYNFDSASCYALTGRSPYAYEPNEIIQMLSRGVYLDAGAVRALEDLGYGEHVGFSVGKEIPEDVAEVYLEHPLNYGLVGKRRACSHIFCNGESYSLIPTENVEILCSLQDLHGRDLSSCSMGLFRNSLGGIVCAASYFPYSELSDSQKSLQIKRVFSMLSKGNLPALVESYDRVRLVAVKTANGLAVAVLNRNLDRLHDVSVLCYGVFASANVVDENCRKIRAATETTGGKNTRVVLTEIEPYQMKLILLNKG